MKSHRMSKMFRNFVLGGLMVVLPMQLLMGQSAGTNPLGATSQPAIPPAQVGILPQSGGPADSVLRNGYFNIQVVLPPGSKLPASITVEVKNEANIINNSRTVTLTRGGHNAMGTVYSSDPIMIDSGSAYTFDWITVKSGGTLDIVYQDGSNGQVKSTFQVYDTALGQAVGRTENYMQSLQTQFISTISFADQTLALIAAGLKAAPCGSALYQKLQSDRASVLNARSIAVQKLILIKRYFDQIAYISSRDDLHLYLYTLQYKWNLASRLIPILLAPNAPDRSEVMDAWNNAANQARDEVSQIQLQSAQLLALGLYQATTELTLAGPVFTLASPIFNKMTNGSFEGMTIWGTQAKGEDYIHAATSVLIAAAMMKGVPAAVDAMGNTLATGGDLRFSGGEFVVGGESGEPVQGTKASGSHAPGEVANQPVRTVNQVAGGTTEAGTGTARYGVGEARRLGVRGPQDFDPATFTDRMIGDQWNGIKSEAAANPLDAAYVKILTAETQINEALRAFANNPAADSQAARAAVASQLYSQYAAGVELVRISLNNPALWADLPADVVDFLRNSVEPEHVVGPEHFRNALGATEPASAAPVQQTPAPVINENCSPRNPNLGNQDGPGNTHVLRAGENPFAQDEPTGPGRTQIIHPTGQLGQITPENGPGSTQVLRQGENPFAQGEPSGPGRTQILNPTTNTSAPNRGSVLGPDRPIFDQNDPTVFGGLGSGSSLQRHEPSGKDGNRSGTTENTDDQTGTTGRANEGGGPSTTLSEGSGGTADEGKGAGNGSREPEGDEKRSGSPNNTGAAAPETYHLPPLPRCKISISFTCSEFGRIAANLAVQAVMTKRDAEEQQMLGKPSADLFGQADAQSKESTEAWDRYQACLHLPFCQEPPPPGRADINSPIYGPLGPERDMGSAGEYESPTFNDCARARDWMQRAEHWRLAAEKDKALAQMWASQGLKDRAESAEMNVKMDLGEQKSAEQQAAYALRECEHRTTSNPPEKKSSDSKIPTNKVTTSQGANGQGGAGSNGPSGGSSKGSDSGKKDTGNTPKTETGNRSDGQTPTTEGSHTGEETGTQTVPVDGRQTATATREVPVPPWGFRVKVNPETGIAEVLPIALDLYEAKYHEYTDPDTGKVSRVDGDGPSNTPGQPIGWWGIDQETGKATWHPRQFPPISPPGRWVDGAHGYHFVPSTRIGTGQVKTVRLTLTNSCSEPQKVDVSQSGFPDGMVQVPEPVTVAPHSTVDVYLTINSAGLTGQKDGTITVSRKSVSGGCQQSQEEFPTSFYVSELANSVALGSDVRAGDYTAMDRMVREHLSSQAINPDEWKVVFRNADGSLTYQSAKTGSTLNARFSKGQVVIQ